MSYAIIAICALLMVFLVSWRLGFVVLGATIALVAYVWIGNPELQAYKRDHPDWAARHPNW